MRTALIALVCAALGAGAALGIGRASVIFGGSTTVVVRERAPGSAAAPTATRAVTVAAPLVGSGGFAPARIFAERSPGVVTVFTFSAGQGA